MLLPRMLQRAFFDKAGSVGDPSDGRLRGGSRTFPPLNNFCITKENGK